MQAEQHQEEGEEEEDEEQEGSGGPDSAFEKSPFQLTAEDVYDISYVLGRELHKLSSEPRLAVPSKVAQLQFKIVSILEMLEALVNETNLTVEALKMERDSLRREVDGLREQAASGSSTKEVSLGPNQMIIDLTDANRPRFTLQELREVLQERNQLKAQLLVAQEELQCYKSGLVPEKQDWGDPLKAAPTVGTTSDSCQREEKTTIKRLFAFKKPR